MQLTPRQKNVLTYLKRFKDRTSIEIQDACNVLNPAKVIYELRLLGVNIPPAKYIGLSANKQKIFTYWVEGK